MDERIDEKKDGQTKPLMELQAGTVINFFFIIMKIYALEKDRIDLHNCSVTASSHCCHMRMLPMVTTFPKYFVPIFDKILNPQHENLLRCSTGIVQFLRSNQIVQRTFIQLLKFLVTYIITYSLVHYSVHRIICPSLRISFLVGCEA